MATLSVGLSTPIYPSGNQEAVTLKNVGAETIYVDNAPIPVGSGAGLPLGSGSSMIWDANKPLYAAAPLTGNGQLLVIENSGNLFDAQAVAVEIINAGLAQDIAQQIAITGAPPIDPLDLLYDISIPSTYPLPINNSLTNLKYRTLLVNITDEGTTQDANEYGQLTFSFSGAKQYRFQIPSGPTWVPNFLVVPVLGPSCNINYVPVSGSGNVAINIRGSYNAYDYNTQYGVYQYPATDSLVTRSEKYILIYANGLSTTAQRIKIPSRLGRCRFRINIIGSANNNTFQFLPYEPGLVGNQYYYINTAVPGTGVEGEIIFGDRPICLRFQLATGNTGFSIVFMYD